MISDEKLEKKERLLKTGEFRKVYNKGSSFAIGPFVLKALSNTLSLSRIGFSISARSIKRATRRNRIRRLFREVFRKNKKELKKNFDMVIVVRKDPGVNFSYKEAETIFVKLAKKTGALT